MTRPRTARRTAGSKSSSKVPAREDRGSFATGCYRKELVAARVAAGRRCKSRYKEIRHEEPSGRGSRPPSRRAHVVGLRIQERIRKAGAAELPADRGTQAADPAK